MPGSAQHGNAGGWINKGSIGNHLKSETHAYSLEARRIQELASQTVQQSMQEEVAVEERMQFVISSSTTQPRVSAKALAPRQSEEEKDMWERYTLGYEVFNAGSDCTHATVEERNRLEREATEFDMWHGEDFISEEVSMMRTRAGLAGTA